MTRRAPTQQATRQEMAPRIEFAPAGEQFTVRGVSRSVPTVPESVFGA